MEKVELARIVAIGAHGKQKYGGYPYTYHLEAVVAQVNTLYPESPKLDLLTQVAWLHDVLEDTELTSYDLEELGFSKEVVTAVTAVTKFAGTDYSDERNMKEYYARIAESSLAYKIKTADTMANLTQSTKEGSHKRIKKYAEQLIGLNVARLNIP